MAGNTVEFVFDVVSPNAYMAWWPLKDVLARTGASLALTPVFLGGMHKLTGNAPPMVRDAEVKGKVEYAMLEVRRFIDKHRLVAFRMNPRFPFNSVALQRMLVAIDGANRIALAEHLLRAVWERELDVADQDAVAAELAIGRFDAGALLTATQDPNIKQRLSDNTTTVVERGVFGIPSFFVGTELFFGKERLGQIEELLAAG